MEERALLVSREFIFCASAHADLSTHLPLLSPIVLPPKQQQNDGEERGARVIFGDGEEGKEDCASEERALLVSWDFIFCATLQLTFHFCLQLSFPPSSSRTTGRSAALG